MKSKLAAAAKEVNVVEVKPGEELAVKMAQVKK